MEFKMKQLIIDENKLKVIKNFFPENWINKILKNEKKNNKLMLSYALNNDYLFEKLISFLNLLKEKCDKFSTVIKKLKCDGDKYEFESLLSELDVLSYFYSQYVSHDIEYEPKINNKKPDLKVKDYFIEIKTIFNIEDERSDKTIDIIESALRNSYKNISILFEISEKFTEADINKFISFINDKYKENKNLNKEERINFFSNNNKIASFNLIPSDENNYIYGNKGIREIKTFGKVKRNFFDKIKKIQVPKNKKSIIIINCSETEYLCNKSIINEVFNGKGAHKYKIRIKNRITFNKKGKFYRENNSLIDDCKKEGIFENFKNISLFIIYTKSFFDNEKYYFFNPFSINPIKKDTLIKKLIKDATELV